MDMWERNGSASGATIVTTVKGSMPGAVKEVAAEVPDLVGPMDHGKEFGFYSECDGQPLEDLGERNMSTYTSTVSPWLLKGR